ncbi:MarR family winged helix-turn-helix transcriptional regulator [Paraburkholderia tagetis]|uniref:MarR family winged helix-turn-helix transcriptional regulator n=1 Tax=Paraburkholderia tagetis TaxID=2913261 RepID=A0A9X1UM50_9BURK|nr:MarR family winged helix-turn-helix transcriptional regulator [Paraburkholderia tagetis]MCG5077692.1 MarR family winged helix-turn-helix transcriptional regulator [Paraburkholderia tagetis]
MAKRMTREECNCFALRQAARFVTQLYERHLSQAGVTAAQFTILSRLAGRPDATAAELADDLVMDRTTLVRALKPLQRDGLVLAFAAEHDTRTLVYRLSADGARRYEKAHTLWLDAQAEFEQHMKRDRARALRAELFALTHAAAQ